jgi:hypothetical protein
MDIIVIFNGLGNQMSQYSFFLAKKNKGVKCKVIFDPRSKSRHNGSELDTIFGVMYEKSLFITFLTFIYKLLKYNFFRKCFSIIGIKREFEPLNYDYNQRFLDKGIGWLNYYVGGWHSENYYHGIRSVILKTFKFPEHIKDAKFEYFKEKLLSSNAVSLHIRRGDFLNVKPGDFYQYGGVATLSYYKKAITFMKKSIENPVFFVFSDDLTWCRINFKAENFIYVDCNFGNNSWRDLYLMTLCKYHINANSTFSWWGAWLCNSENQITVCPTHFLLNVVTKDFYPKDWIRIS